jgi:mRNA-degrading endonuclease RelE of RelBE toxin-antitoxin system
MKIYLDRDCTKQIKRLKKDEKLRILRRLKALEIDPFLGKKLKGRENTYSLRIGKFRIIYEIHVDLGEIWVLKIDKRERVYDRI